MPVPAEAAAGAAPTTGARAAAPTPPAPQAAGASSRRREVRGCAAPGDPDFSSNHHHLVERQALHYCNAGAPHPTGTSTAGYPPPGASRRGSKITSSECIGDGVVLAPTRCSSPPAAAAACAASV